MKVKFYQPALLSSLTLIPYILSKIFNFNKNLTIITCIFIFLILISYKKLQIKNKTFDNLISRLNSINSVLYLVSLTIFILISQNFYLIYEIVTWDVPSYLVGSQEIGKGYLPFETQWESKGPLLTYIYYFFSYISGHSYIYFRVVSDIILILLTFFLFYYTYKVSNNKLISSISSLVFAAMCSMRWYVSEYSEYFSLFFIALAFIIFYRVEKTFKTLFVVGILIGISSLVNQASILFVLPYIIYSFDSWKTFYKSTIYLFIGGFLPHLIFILLYTLNDMLDIYISNYFSIPLGYSRDVSESSIYEMRVWFREFYEFNKLIYFSLIGLIFGFIFEIKNNFSQRFILLKKDLVLLNILISIVIYFVGAHNYSHHLIYFIFFLPLLSLNISKNYLQISIAVLVFVGASSIFVKSYDTSIYNLRNLKNVENSYPLKKLSNEIRSNFNDDSFEIFALDYLLILYYLEKTNYSYIVHPTNHFEDYITNVLEKINKIEPDNVKKLLNEKPEVIICSPKRIHKGELFINNEFSCDPETYYEEYYLLETEVFRTDPKLAYYWDPYKTINVFVKLKK